MIILGIDVGTQGARALACDSTGAVLAHADEPFPLEAVTSLPDGWFEQNPNDWWSATTRVLRHVVQQLNDQGQDISTMGGVSVTSTSGTLCVVNERGDALGGALMYNDRRSHAEAKDVSRAGGLIQEKLGYRFASSFALPKLLWLRRHDADRFDKAHFFLSPTDFILGRLTGVYGVTDYTNALKTGYDLIDQKWPAFIETDLGIPLRKLPKVVAPGAEMGRVSGSAAKETGLPPGISVLAGMTDGCASQVSTGAVSPGQWNSTLGTTLVIKGVTRDLLRDPEGRVYCHRHPDGFWLPGGASNTGAQCITQRFAATNLATLASQALQRAPTDLIVYPLTQTGERFPFNHASAEGFVLGSASDEATLYTAHLEGVGYVERLAYEVLQNLGAEIGHEIFAAGGTAKVDAWLQLRADILGKTMLVPAHGGGAMGAAIIAAGGALYQGIVPAAQAMVRIDKRFEPRSNLKFIYDERYNRFCTELRGRGYIH